MHRYIQTYKEFWPREYLTADYSNPYAVELQDPQPPHGYSAGERDSLVFALDQVKSLEDENMALTEKLILLENQQREESRLQQGTGKDRRKIMVNIKAHNLDRLNEVHQKLLRTLEQEKKQIEYLEATLMEKDNQIQALERKIILLQIRDMNVDHLPVEVRGRDDVLQKEVNTAARAPLYARCLQGEAEQKGHWSEEQWKGRCDGLESNLIQKDGQPQDPEVMAALQDVSQNPANISKYQNPKIMALVTNLSAKFGAPPQP